MRARFHNFAAGNIRARRDRHSSIASSTELLRELGAITRELAQALWAYGLKPS
jgi:hypothetical protein